MDMFIIKIIAILALLNARDVKHSNCRVYLLCFTDVFKERVRFSFMVEPAQQSLSSILALRSPTQSSPEKNSHNQETFETFTMRNESG